MRRRGAVHMEAHFGGADKGNAFDAGMLEEGLRQADVIFHLAGVNRPKDEAEFHTGNTN